MAVTERACRRLAVQTGCWLVEVDGVSCLRTFDLSDDGVCVVGTEPLPIGRTVTLQFFTPQSATATPVEAEVVWVRDEAETCIMGLKFTAIDQDAREVLSGYAAFLRQRSAP